MNPFKGQWDQRSYDSKSLLRSNVNEWERRHSRTMLCPGYQLAATCSVLYDKGNRYWIINSLCMRGQLTLSDELVTLTSRANGRRGD